MLPSTGTLCPFPYTTANGSDPVSLADCTHTFAEVNQPGYDVLDALLGVFGVCTLLITLYRVFMLKRLADSQHKYLRDMPTFEFFIFALGFTLAVSLESVDLWSMRAWTAAEFYFMADEFVAASAFCMGVCMVDFWRKLDHGIGKHGLQPRVKRAFIVVGCFNFPMWEAFGLSIPSQYQAFEGIKDLVGAVLASTLMVLSFTSVRELLRTLNKSKSSSDDPAVSSARARSTMSRRAARTLVIKYAMFCLATFIAAVAFLACVFLGRF